MRSEAHPLPAESLSPDCGAPLRALTAHAGGDLPTDRADPKRWSRAIRLAVLQTHSLPSPCLRVLCGTRCEVSPGVLQTHCNSEMSFIATPRRSPRERNSPQPNE